MFCAEFVREKLAVIGVIFKLRTGLRWKKLSLVLYLGMGWLILLAFRQFVHAVPTQTVIWLLAGGIAYTSGVVFFGNERLRYSHFVWHLFVNAKILAISEDKIEGFVREPFEEIAARSGVPVVTVMERIAAMLRAGTIRRVRQTLLATNLADGALVAWKVAPEKIDAAFDYMSQCDPFSGHVVLRSTDSVTPGSEYKLWTTLKVPRGFSLQHHGELLANKLGAEHFRLMPAKGIFTLGVGHVRRKTMSRAKSRHHRGGRGPRKPAWGWKSFAASRKR